MADPAFETTDDLVAWFYPHADDDCHAPKAVESTQAICPSRAILAGEKEELSGRDSRESTTSLDNDFKEAENPHFLIYLAFD
jgi:hypothetical protein